MSADTNLEKGSCYSCEYEAFGRRMITIREATRVCKMSKKTIYNWMNRGWIEWVKTAGGRRRVLLDSLTRHVSLRSKGRKRGEG